MRAPQANSGTLALGIYFSLSEIFARSSNVPRRNSSPTSSVTVAVLKRVKTALGCCSHTAKSSAENRQPSESEHISARFGHPSDLGPTDLFDGRRRCRLGRVRGRLGVCLRFSQSCRDFG